MKFGTNLRLFGLVLAVFGCKPSSAVPPASRPAAEIERPSKISVGKTDGAWCAGGEPSPLAKWKNGSIETRVGYCSRDSLDATGITVFSRLDVRQEDPATGAVAWKIHDEVGKGLTTIKMFRPAFTMRDIDGNGTNETFFGYYFASEGLDPVRVKFMGHIDGKKYAIRGEIPMAEDDSALFKMEFDPAFASAPQPMKNVADSLFREFVVKLCTDPDLGLGIQVPPRIRKR